MDFVLLTESFPWENEHIKKYNFTKTKKIIIEKTIKNNIIYEINSTSKETISYSYGNSNYITIIDSNNVDMYLNKNLLNIYLYVDDETKLYENFSKIYNNFYGWISFKLKSLEKYNISILIQELIKIKNFNNELLKNNIYLPINEFENYIYDKNYLIIKDDFSCTLNPYYYNNESIVYNILTQNIINKDLKFVYSNDFIEKNNIFEIVSSSSDEINVNNLSIIKMKHDRKLFESIYKTSNFEVNNGN